MLLPGCDSTVSQIWRRFFLQIAPEGIWTSYEHGSGRTEVTTAWVHFPLDWYWVRTSWPIMAGGSSGLGFADCDRWCCCSRCVTASLFADWFRILIGRLAFIVRQFSSSTDDGKWSSTGVDCSTSSTISLAMPAVSLSLCFTVCNCLYKSIWLWEVVAGSYVVETFFFNKTFSSDLKHLDRRLSGLSHCHVFFH